MEYSISYLRHRRKNLLFDIPDPLLSGELETFLCLEVRDPHLDQNEIRLTVGHDDSLLHVGEAGLCVVGDTEQMLLIMFFLLKTSQGEKIFNIGNYNNGGRRKGKGGRNINV